MDNKQLPQCNLRFLCNDLGSDAYSLGISDNDALLVNRMYSCSVLAGPVLTIICIVVLGPLLDIAVPTSLSAPIVNNHVELVRICQIFSQ